MTTIVNGLEEEFKGALQCDILDSTTEENIAQIKAYGFDNHGLVVFDAAGNVSSKMNGHGMREPEIRAALDKVMGES